MTVIFLPWIIKKKNRELGICPTKRTLILEEQNLLPWSVVLFTRDEIAAPKAICTKNIAFLFHKVCSYTLFLYIFEDVIQFEILQFSHVNISFILWSKLSKRRLCTPPSESRYSENSSLYVFIPVYISHSIPPSSRGACIPQLGPVMCKGRRVELRNATSDVRLTNR